MESEGHFVPYFSGPTTGYSILTEAPAAAASTTFRTISVKKFATASTSSSVQNMVNLSTEAFAVTVLENTVTSTTSSLSLSEPLSSSLTSIQSTTILSSSIANTSVAVRETSTSPIPNPETTTPTSASRTPSDEIDIPQQTTSLTPPPTILPTSTATLLALPTTSVPKFTHSPLPSSSQTPSRKPLTITFMTLGSVSLVLLLVTFSFFRKRRRWNDSQGVRISDGSGRKRWSIKRHERGGRRTVHELITSANVHEKDGESVDLSKSLPPFKSGSLRSGTPLGGSLKEGMKGSFRRGRERVYELECEEREEVNWMNLKNKVRERTVERLGSTLGIEGRREVREGVYAKGRKRGKSVRWAVA